MQVKRFTAAGMAVTVAATIGGAAGLAHAQTAPIQIGFLWHMHQPIYYPYESVIQTDANARFSFSVVDVHNQRFGPYTTWPRDAVQAGAALPHLGASVSFTGSLIENLDAIEAAGVNGGMWNNWDGAYDASQSMVTTEGNRRLDLVAFGYHHPLLPLLDERDARMQIQLHKHVYAQAWTGGSTYARGMFPPETAFGQRVIPWLVAEGIEWVLVDNIHFDRACENYPHTNASSIYAPNRADQINPDPAATGGAWVQLQNLWAPSQVSAPFGYRPHFAQRIDPDTGAATQMVVVPAARYEGNEDGRGGYGAFLYDQVMDAYLPYNTDPAHPMFVVLHHDGDNFGGGSESYYHSNFQSMVNWVSADADYDVSTVQDYLDRFPPAPGDVIHVENGSWAGADAGDPEFKKWLGDPDAGGWSPDRNSWAVLTAAKNRVFHADELRLLASQPLDMQDVLDGTGGDVEIAWHFLLAGEASDHWYWDGTEVWDSNVTRACNQAVVFADAAIASAGGAPDPIGPTVFVPQREPYNPGGYEWGATPEPSDFEVWTYVYDVGGLGDVTLKWRVDADGVNPIASVQNETFAGGPEVGAWNSVAMSSSDVAPQNGVLAPTYRALRYGAMITGQQDVLIDYYVESIDGAGNVTRSDIQHVWVGQAAAPPGDGGVTIDPDPAQAGQSVLISYDPAGGPLAAAGQVHLHYGFNSWSPTISPDPAMSWNAAESLWEISVPVQSSATQLDVVFNDGGGTWDNNNGQDWHFTVQGAPPPPGFVMDGQLDAGAIEATALGGLHLWVDLEGDTLYVATEDAGEGNDHFIYVALNPGPLQNANWAKGGSVATWDAYLADENDNDFEAWFDASGTNEAATGANGGVLEGTLNLAEELGALPDGIYLAVGVFGTLDGNGLVAQLGNTPAFNADGEIEAEEFLYVDLNQFAPPTGCDGDLDDDGDTDVLDFAVFTGTFGQSVPPGTGGDLDGDGDVDVLDFGLFAADFGCVTP